MTGRREVLVALALAAAVLLAGCTAALDGGGDEQVEWFEEVGDEAGVTYETTNETTDMYGGAFVSDYDGDDDPDLLLTGGDRPVLLENQEGSFVRSDALPAVEGPIKSALFLDHDNDGDDDLLLVPRRGHLVFLENRDGRFARTDVGLDVNLSLGMGATAGDFDRDGCLDLFVIQNGDWRDRVPIRSSGGSLSDDNGNPNYLFEGDCGSFERVADAGITGERWSLAASFADLTGDGYPDIHVANDFNRDVVYVNQQDGTFERRELADSNRHGMASAVANVTGDERPEVFVSNIEYDDPDDVWGLQSGLGVVNRGNNVFTYEDGRFRDRATELGVRRGGWGWAGTFVDLDGDGDRELVHTTKDYLTMSDDMEFEPVETRPALYERTADGFVRRNASRLGFEHSSGRGLVTLDYDGDGDRDVLVADVTGRFKLYENTLESGRSVTVEVEPGGGQTALGARVVVRTDEGTESRLLTSGSNFLSQAPRTLHVGVGDAAVQSVRVVYPDGRTVRATEVAAGQRVTVGYDGSVTSSDR